MYLQYCKVCQAYKAPRSHHCRKCNRYCLCSSLGTDQLGYWSYVFLSATSVSVLVSIRWLLCKNHCQNTCVHISILLNYQFDNKHSLLFVISEKIFFYLLFGKNIHLILLLALPRVKSYTFKLFP